MPVAKHAIERFLNRELDDFLWIKHVPPDELHRELAAMTRGYRFRTPPLRHQLQCLFVALCCGDFLPFLDLGLGKTLLSLYYIDILRHTGKTTRPALAVVPNDANVENWCMEVAEHTAMTAVGLLGDAAQRWRLLEQPADIYIINYGGLLPMMTRFASTPKSKKRSKKRVLDPELRDEFCRRFQLVAFDEIHKAMNAASLTFALCNELAQRCDYRLGLTGTPIGRDPTKFWAQFYLVDRGATLGTNERMYLRAFFNSEQQYFGGVKYQLKAGCEQLLHTTMRHRSLYYKDSECGDLPPLRHQHVWLTLGAEPSTVYGALMEEAAQQQRHIRQTMGSDADVEKAVLRVKSRYYGKLRQVASGFLYDDGGEAEEEEAEVDEEGKSKARKRTVHVFRNNAKLEALEELLSEMPSDRKAVIFYHYITSGDILHDALTRWQYRFVTMRKRPGQPHAARDAYRRFREDGEVQILLAGITTGGIGLNLQVANYQFYYEQVDDPRSHRQSSKRVHRMGQTQTVFMYTLLIRNTIEERVLSFLEEGKSLHRALVEGEAELVENRDEFKRHHR